MSKKVNGKWEDQLEGTWAATGFAVVLIIVGLPVWWYTTTVYRAALPYSSIEELSKTLVYQTLHIEVICDNLQDFRAKFERESQDIGELVKFSVSSRQPRQDESDILRLQNVEAINEKLSNVRTYHAGTLSVFVLPRNNGVALGSQIFIGIKRFLITREDVDIALLIQTLKSMSIDPLVRERLLSHKAEQLPSVKNNRLQLLRQVPTEPGYDITITLMIPQPHLLKADSSLTDVVEVYLAPLLNQLKEVADLRVRSQVLYMTSLKVSPKWSEKNHHFALPQQQLPLTINAIESKLGSFVSTRPSLHFIVYVPRRDHTPLHIHTTDDKPIESNSFLVPRWGGVIIHNPMNLRTKNNKSEPQYFDINASKVMQIVVTHLHKLLPVPQVEAAENAVAVSRAPQFILSDWQLDGLARARTIMYLNTINITLQSLCDLVDEINNMVVSDEVSGWVWAAVRHWRRCLYASREGRVQNATAECTLAFQHSDAAFFHPSMLALLYFPDNQKYAIYIPLFLPVSIPVILSLKMIFTMLRQSKSKTQ